MAGSLNKVMLIGNLGNDPEVRSMTSGDEVASFSVATSESWKDKASGERKERTQWHKVVIFNSALVNVARNYLHKGSKVFIEGQLETRKWTDKDGRDQYTTEVVLRPYRGELTMLDSKGGSSSNNVANDSYGESSPSGGGYSSGSSYGGSTAAAVDELADDIPF
ncbi:MAG: single-stranded DNA-binding protein [Alphaproteobacteria bacterium]|jgi:single-strand DNA-binding protein|nr:single-stranded DNA-binding protein [Alphaproteobacteria bacterium]MCB1550564.1 single-stranded DNA-binding protein [Alphaproteobacteria bacterium]MCB9984228.1 single-stranded DNA-binding protein [Micavibrio sp.]HRK97072.1 single-stranded DNA-binding protein [Alphaproteobacteria bacterium]